MLRQEDIERFISQFEAADSSQDKKDRDECGKDLLAQKRKKKRKASDTNSSADAKHPDDKMLLNKHHTKSSLQEFILNFESSAEYIAQKLSINLLPVTKHSELVYIENFLPTAVASDLLRILEHLPETEWDSSSSEADAKMHKYQSSNAGSTNHSFSASCGLVVDSSRCLEQFTNEAATDMDKFLCILSSGFKKNRSTVTTSAPNTQFTFQCGRYTKGNFIEPHDDSAREEINGEVYERDLAIVLYLSKAWTFEMGGLFVDLAGNPPRPIVPKFNSLVCFNVPRLHQVTPIEFDSVKRYSVFGWYLKLSKATLNQDVNSNVKHKKKKKMKFHNVQSRSE